MQKRQGYCSYCRVQYANLEQHLFSAQHRTLTRQSRRRPCTSSLMERFLQDVLRHHPYNYQDSRSAQNEIPANPGSPEVVVLDDTSSEEKDEDTATGSSEEMYSDDSESVEELNCGPSKSRDRATEVLIRPSVIQKLEKGQPQSLEFVHKIQSGMRKVNPVHIGQATYNGKKIIRPPVICQLAPASHLPKSAYDRPIARLPLAASSDSFVDGELDVDPEVPTSSPVETPSDSSETPKEKKPFCINLNKLILQTSIKSKRETSTPDVTFRELNNIESSVRVESSESAANSAVNLNETDAPSDIGISDGAIPKHHEESRSDMDCSPEEKYSVFKKPELLKQKCSVSSGMKFDCGSLQSVSGQSQEAVQALKLWKEEQVDQEDKSHESRGSEMSFDCGSSSHSLTALPELTGREMDFAGKKEMHKNNKSGVSGATADRGCDESPRVVTNQSQENVKEIKLQNTKRISLVDESYESSDSEMNFDGDDSLQSTNDYPQQPVKKRSLTKKVRIELVDRSYGSSSSEASDDSFCSLDEPPVAVTEVKLRKKPQIRLVDESYGSSSSEASFDSDSSLDHPQMTVKERNRKDRRAHLKNKKRKPSSAKAHLDCDASLETVADEPQKDGEEINLLKEKRADLVDMNCESHGPEMGFHADAQLVADQSQVAFKEVNPQKVDIDLENKSVQSSISNLSFDSHAFLYQSANDEPQGALGEVNLKELNVDMEVKSWGCSSSELTFDSDSPLLSVTERSQLDVERINEDHINLEDESCESSSSDLTFDSDIADCSVVDQPEVAVYEEEPVDLENKSNESCISEITFDSDIPLHSGIDLPEVAVEVIIQEEEYVHLEGKNDKPIDSEISSDSEISLDSYAPLHSVTNSPEVDVTELNSLKEEQVDIENKENEPTDSELNLDYDIFHSKLGHFEDPIEVINFHKEQHEHLENKNNALSVSETRLDSDVPLQSVIHKHQVVVKNIWFQKEKHAELQGKSAEFSGSEINPDSDVPDYQMIEPQVPVKITEKKTQHILEKERDKYGGSELIFNSNVFPQSMNEKTQQIVLNESHVDPQDESTGPKDSEINLNIDGCLLSVTDQPHLVFWKEKHVDLKDKNSKSSDSEISLNSVDPLTSLPEEHHEAVEKINLWKAEAADLEDKIDEPNDLKVIHDSDLSFHSAADQPDMATKQISLENEDQVHVETKNGQCSYPETSLDSDFLVQSIVDQPKTILEPEHIELEGPCNQSCDSEVSFDSDDSLQPVADQLSETGKEVSLWKDEEVGMEGKRDEAEGFEITYDSDTLQPVAGQTEVVQQITLWKEHADVEGKIVESSGSKINFDSDEPLWPVTNNIQEPVEITEGHVCLDNKGYEPHSSGVIRFSHAPHRSVIQSPQSFQERYANLEGKSSDPCGPEISFESSDPCQSVAGQLEKPVKEINVKEDHIYLEDKSYRQVDFQASDGSDIPIQFVADQPVVDVSVKEISSQKEDQNDLENENYNPPCSEIRYDSDIHLQSEVDPSQMAYEETNLQKKELADMEEKSSEPSDSEMLYESDVSFQIVVNPCQTSDGEADSPEVVFVDVASDSDCDREVISDPSVPLQLVTDPPQMTVSETSHINTQSVNSDNYFCELCGSKVKVDCRVSPQSVANQSKKSFKIINRENDYIILGDYVCQSCGSEINFNVDTSHQSMTYQSQGPDQNCIDPEDKSCESNGPKRNFDLEDTSQPVTHQPQEADKEVSLGKDPKNAGLQEKSWEPSVSSVGHAAPSVSVIRQTARKDNPSKLKQRDLGSTSGKSSDSQLNTRRDPSLHCDTNQPQEAVKKTRPRKRVTFDLGEKSHDSRSSSVPRVDSLRNLEKAKEVIEDDPDEPVLEALPHVPPSFVGKTWSQIMREDDIKVNALVKEFKEGRFHCYFDDDSETKKGFLNEEKTTGWPDSNQETASLRVLSAREGIGGRVAETGGVAVGVDRPCSHFHLGEGLRKQNWHGSSQNQMAQVSHGTGTSVMNYPLKKRKITRKEEESPKRKQLQSNRKGKKKAKIETVDFPASQPGSSVYVRSSNLKEGESFNSPKMKHVSCDDDLQFMCKFQQNNPNDPLLKKTVIIPPQNLTVPDFERHKRDDIDLNRSDLSFSAQEDGGYGQNLASTSFMTPTRYELRSRYRTSESSAFLEDSEHVTASEVPKDSHCQLTLLSPDVGEIAPKSVKNKFFKSKRKILRRKIISNKLNFSQNAYKTVVFKKKSIIPKEKLSVWIQMKASDIIRKYVSRSSWFSRNRHQSRRDFIRRHLQRRRAAAYRAKQAKGQAEMLLNSVSPSGAEEQLSAVLSSPEQPAQHPASAAGAKKHEHKIYRRKRRIPIPVREYELRSSCYIPDSDRMVTRFISKLRCNEIK